MMVNRIITLVLFVFAMTGVIAQSFDLKEVDVNLNKIYDDDQQVRKKWQDAFQKNLPNLQEIIAEMDSIDSYNQRYVSKLLDEYGWPNNLSEQAHKAIWFVIDHANNQFAEKYFPVVKEKGEQGILLMLYVVTLEDRILMRNNKKQKYGTQTVNVFYTNNKTENIIYVWPIEDNEKVDELRVSVGLPPLDLYLQFLGNEPNTKIVWDKNLTIDDMKEKFPWHFSK